MFSVPLVFKHPMPEWRAMADGNNAAWNCKCGLLLLGPTLHATVSCPRCGTQYRVVGVGAPGTTVSKVEET